MPNSLPNMCRPRQAVRRLRDASRVGSVHCRSAVSYKDLEGWDNSHSDWSAPQIRLLREKVRLGK